MDAKRKKFWEFFLKQFEIDCKEKFSLGPMPFKRAKQEIYNQIVESIMTRLDSILAPTIIMLIQEQKKSDNTTDKHKRSKVYDSIFSGEHESTLALLEKFHSETIVNIINRCRKFKSHFFVLMDRVFNDWEDLKVNFLLKDDDDLSDVRLTCGDEHFWGGQTSMFIFNSNTNGFVYKPLNLNLDLMMQKIMSVVNDRKLSHVITKNDHLSSYGYIKLFEYREKINSIEEAMDIYRQFGQLLAFGRFFKIADGHCDNIIISKNGVQWIDLESSFHFTKDTVYEVHPLEETGLIYEAKPENCHIGIVTGIQGGVIPRLALTSPSVYEDGTDAMFIRYFKTFIPNRLCNRVFLNGTICRPEEFCSSIQEGYVEGVKKLVNKRKNILRIINEFFSSHVIQSRYLIQMTAYYARFIGLLNHVVALRKNDVVHQIKTERTKTIVGSEYTIKDFIIENELIDLVNGVIPYFYRTNNDRALYTANGSCRKDFFSQNLLEEIERHIMSISLDQTALKNDCFFIRRALMSTENINNFADFKDKFNFAMFDFKISGR